MNFYHILLVFSLHLMMITKAYIILEETSDNDKSDDVKSLRDGMTTFVSRPRFSSYTGNKKRTADLSDDYRELRKAANKAGIKRYVILREIDSDDVDDFDNEDDKRDSKESTGSRVLLRVLDSHNTKREIPNSRTRFGNSERDVPNGRTRFGNDKRDIPNSRTRFGNDKRDIPNSRTRFGNNERDVPNSRTRFGNNERDIPNSRTRFGNRVRQADLHNHFVNSRYSGKRVSPIDVYQRPRFNGGDTIDRREKKKYKVILLDD